MELRANFIFKGANTKLLTEELKNYFVKEFVDRREIFINMVNPMYEQWNQEFDCKYPDLDGCSSEYLNFICEKQREALKKSNESNVMLNEVTLVSNRYEAGDICGYIKLLGVYIYLTLVQGGEAQS